MEPTLTNYTQARANFARLCERAAHNQEVIVIQRRKALDVALISASELSGLMETAHLLRSPKNATRLLTALKRARTGKGKTISIKRLQKELGFSREGS